ncbi:MAG TPA: hypothetical protein VGK90_11620 [Rhizomicrobium sp.]|jgi:hypothetical protein
MKLLIGIIAMTLTALPAIAGEVTRVLICELLQHPARYEGKLVQTQGIAAGRSGCRHSPTPWVETGDGRHGADFGRAAPGKGKVTVTGIFRWRPSSDTPAILHEIEQ